MRLATLTNEERGKCYGAVNFGDNSKGHSIDDGLITKMDIIKKLKEGCTQVEDSVDFKTCDESKPIELTNKELNIIVKCIKTSKYQSAEAAQKGKELADKLEELPQTPKEEEPKKFADADPT